MNNNLNLTAGRHRTLVHVASMLKALLLEE